MGKIVFLARLAWVFIRAIARNGLGETARRCGGLSEKVAAIEKAATERFARECAYLSAAFQEAAGRMEAAIDATKAAAEVSDELAFVRAFGELRQAILDQENLSRQFSETRDRVSDRNSLATVEELLGL